MNARLQQAIEQLYCAFSDVPKPDAIDGCPCCIERKGVDVLLIKPLREINPDELTNYAASVFLTVGSIPDFTYLLPRILEVSATDPGWWPDVEVVLQSLKNGEFYLWPENRKRAVLQYFDAVFAELVSKECPWLIDSWICALGRLFDDVSPYLNQLKAHPKQVILYFEHNSESLNEGKLTNAFWEHDSPAYKQVMDWFKSQEIKTIIKAEYGL